MALQNILIPFVSIFRSAGLKQAQSALGGLNKQYDNLGKTIGAAVGAMAGFSALQTAQQFISQSVESTQKFERNLLALNQVFEDATPSLIAFTKEVQNYGLSQSQAAQASVFLGSVLKQYGFNVNEANAQTQNLVVLAQDLATTFGYDVQEALLAITALFRGEYDPIEKFGVAMKQNEINAVRAARGLGDLTGAAEMQADAQIRLELLFERASDSMGAFERATNTLYGSQQLLTASLQNLQVAAGAPLQEPLAAINNIFTAIISENGEQIVDVFEEMGTTVEMAAPAIETLGTTLANLVGFLQPVIALGNVLIGLTSKLVELFGNALNPVLEFINLSIDKFALGIEELSLKFRIWKKSIEDTPLEAVLDFLGAAYESGLGVGKVFDEINEAIKITTDRYKVLLGIFPELEDGQKQASAAARRAGYAARELNKELAEQEQRLKNAAKASLEYLDYLESIGASVGRREFTPSVEAGTDYVGDFFAGIRDAVKKESARLRLEAMGASEGLIEAILGAGGWEQVYDKVVKGGIKGLQDLQDEFNKTAAGIDELTKAAEDLAKAQEKAREAAQAAIDENIRNLEAAAKTAEETYQRMKAAADDFKRWTLSNISQFSILPDVEEEVGRFESAVIGSIANMQSGLESAFRSGLIFEEDFTKLQRWVETETSALQKISRQRDELAKRYQLSEALIGEYKAALTGGLRLTSLFSRLKNQTETVVITEVQQGVVKLGDTLREFGVTVTRSYEKTVENVQDKSSGLLGGFRDMAQKARDFAENLRKLRDMGLDPMLFNQLVEAGVEAGGETAQALVDGGSETITEINGLFQEVNQLGADLGEEVAATMYGAGIDMSNGLLEGLASEQQRLLDEVRKLAKELSQEFSNNLSLAIDKPVKKAQEAAEEAANAVDQARTVNADAVATLQNIISKAQTALAGPLSDVYRAGIEEKLGAARALLKDVLSGQVQSITGIASGISSAAFQTAALATGGKNVTQYYTINVTSSDRVSGAKAGQAVAENLQQFVSQNGGNLLAWTNA